MCVCVCMHVCVCVCGYIRACVYLTCLKGKDARVLVVQAPLSMDLTLDDEAEAGSSAQYLCQQKIHVAGCPRATTLPRSGQSGLACNLHKWYTPRSMRMLSIECQPWQVGSGVKALEKNKAGCLIVWFSPINVGHGLLPDRVALLKILDRMLDTVRPGQGALCCPGLLVTL